VTQQEQKDNAEENNQLEIGGRYAKYVLFVLLIVYVFNFIDRQILSILAEDIKADLGISDAEIGFLYGTAFAVFYAVFGIPLGRLADTWIRKNLIAIGLLFWSLMTALSGTARSFGMLATYRIGVGIGEASASPAAFSMLADYFSPKQRATVSGIYASGVYIGAGIGIFLGGLILDGWHDIYPDPQASPFNLKGWHVAFFAVGIPGILMAIWVATIKEPIRGISEGLVVPSHPTPFRESWKELQAMMPLINLILIYRNGPGIPAVITNLIALVSIFTLSCLLVFITGDLAQWVALGFGVYVAFCWSQNLRYSDSATFHMMFGSKTFVLAVCGFPFLSFIAYGLSFWGPPYVQRAFGVSASEAGTVMGLCIALGGWLGVTLGGFLGDWFRERSVLGRYYVVFISLALCLPTGLGFTITTDKTIAYIAFFLFSAVSPMWLGCAVSTINDLVMPRMRAIASAFYILMLTFIGLALGPYSIGLASDIMTANGVDHATALRYAMILGLAALLPATINLVWSSSTLQHDESSRLIRARSLGEPI